MISKYLIHGKLYLKEKINIQCAEYVQHSGSWSTIHEWVVLDRPIDIIDYSDHKLIFNKGKVFIYWCDISIFTNLHCYTINEVRDKQIKIIIE